MWIVIFIAQSREMANRVTGLLRSAGLLVKMRSSGTKDDQTFGCYEILLPDSEVEEGHSILISNLF